jgi:seryl-tRNA synthetase
MLLLSFIRQHPERVKERLRLRNFDRLDWIDELIVLDEARKKQQFEQDEVRARIKQLSHETGSLMRSGNLEEAERKKAEVAECKIRLADLSALELLEEKINHILVQIPNLPADGVPAGRNAEDNEVVREGGVQPSLPAQPLAHWDLARQYGLIDFELGNKITGSGFPVYLGRGARLQRALIQYFLDFNIAAGYTEYAPPYLVNEASALGTGQLPDKEGQMYYVGEDKLYLIPTAEVPVTNIYRDNILKESDLPVRMTAYTPCFRREAGSYGKDVRGLNRVHQFDKVEIVQIAHPDKSYQALEEMLGHVERLLQTLHLPYRILKLCAGDMGFASALTYDFEVFSAAQQRWLEVSSVSNFESFQTNRMKIRFKDGKDNRLAHSLNGSSLALPRIVASLLENHQKAKSIELPEVLHRYFGAEAIS